LIRLVRASGARGVGLDPLEQLLEQARLAVADARLTDRVEIVQGVMQSLPFPDGDVDLVWCRDVVDVLDPLEPAIAEAARVLRPRGHLLVYTVVCNRTFRG
jgi:ubiquinone/menaquinone biosynthesis C-methylase UbiE